ncbi:MAG TPA: glycosyltransferase family 2 protein [Mucilaginibacter sp.]|jgi:GT2 family glycosyltransferase|nr:glycosyltransferase family 2 protein [Mucilaginibacter sp.]
MPKPVAIILLNWNTPEHTANCIVSLNSYCDKSLFDIIVADNGSTDGSLFILKTKFPDLIYIDNKENLGFAEGNNRALIYSIENGYTYSLVMNTDTEVDEDLVACLTTHLDNYTYAAAVQPAIYWMHNRENIWNGEGKFNAVPGITVSDKTRSSPGDTYKNAQWVTGCCMLLRNSALTMSGLFNKQFFLYYEDVELSFRLREHGYEVHYLPSCKMYHEAGVSAQVEKKEGFLSPIIHYYISRNHFWFLRRYGKPVFYPINIFYNGLYYLAVWTYLKLRGRNEKAAFIIKGLKEGLFTPKNTIWP